MSVAGLGEKETLENKRMSIKAHLTQPDTGASEHALGLGDTGSDCNFLNDDWANSKGFVPLTQCDVEFVTFYGNKFKTYHAYDLDVLITDDRKETRLHKLRFYGCKATSYRLVFGMEFYESTIAQYCDYVKKR